QPYSSRAGEPNRGVSRISLYPNSFFAALIFISRRFFCPRAAENPLRADLWLWGGKGQIKNPAQGRVLLLGGEGGIDSEALPPYPFGAPSLCSGRPKSLCDFVEPWRGFSPTQTNK